MNAPPLARLPMVLLTVVAVAVGAQWPAAATDSGAPVPERPSTVTTQSSPDVRAGELLVKAAAGRQQGLQRAMTRVNARALRSLGGGVALVAVPPGEEAATAAALGADPAVAYAEPNYVRSADGHAGEEVSWGVRATRAPRLWARSAPVTGAGVRVAVLDSGVDAAHSQLKGRVAPGRDMYHGRGRDDCGHGTAVAGVIAAAHDGKSTVGVAPEATIVPVKVLRYDDFFGMCGGDDASIVAGLRWAADEADIINMSFGGPHPSAALRDAITYAAGKGALMVAASGNTGDRSVNYPAAYRQVLSVGGLRRSSGEVRWWPQSSFGSVDLAAPAANVPVLKAGGVEAARIGRACVPDDSYLCSDGTSFAAPHVAGVAALLHEEHAELAELAPGARTRRLRQWVLGAAPRVDKSRAGVDLKTGHGSADAVASSGASRDPARLLLTWTAGERVLSPTSRMTATPARLSLQLVAMYGTGAPAAGEDVTFTTGAASSVDPAAATTGSTGRVGATFRSRAAGKQAALGATVAGRTLRIRSYVLQFDDNVPGVRPPASPFRDRLDLPDDVDDVFRFSLRTGETLRADVTEVDRRREFVVLYLHRGTTRDVTDPYRAPLREDAGFREDPQRLARTASEDGVHYLDVYGYGDYRLRWWIVSPDRIVSASASPATFSPNGDGYRDTTRLSWKVRTPGRMVLKVRNSAGKTIRTVDLGRRAKGWHSYRWNGRNNRSTIVRDGTYRVRLEWSNNAGRRWSLTTNVKFRT